MHKVDLCKAVCANCQRDFPYPSLGDFAYGNFVLNRADGREFRYLQAGDNPIWDFVREFLKPHNTEQIEVFQEVVARLADSSAGQTFTMKHVCPYCGSNRFRDWGSQYQSALELAEATFEAFNALPDHAKRQRVVELQQLIEEISG
jgi:hypothetical protein